MKTPSLMKALLLCGVFSLFAINMQAQCSSSAYDGNCIDVSLGLTGTTLSVEFEPSGAITASPPLSNVWQFAVITIRWPAIAGGGNPVSSMTNLLPGDINFNMDFDEMIQASGFKGAVLDNGYYYQKFAGIPSPSTFDVSGTPTLFTVDFTTSESTITFELVDNAFTSTNNGSPSIGRFPGETFDTFGSSPSVTFNSASLPVEWLYFNAEAVSSSAAELTWATATESNNDFFQIEKSVDGELFEVIARVQAVGNSATTQEYDYLDKDFVANKVFYRLKQVDVDGKFTYAEVVEVNFDPALNELQFDLFPNPATTEVTLKALQSMEGTYRVSIVDATGRKVWEGVYKEDATSLVMPVQRFAEGIYAVYMVGPRLGSNYLVGRFVKK